MKHIYIIEDDPGILEALTFLLEKTYKVTVMNDARMALNRLQDEQPDLILLDLLMPDLNGGVFIEAFSKQALKIPIVVMSASSNVNIKLNYPMVAEFIRKPFQIDKMLTTISNLLDTKR